MFINEVYIFSYTLFFDWWPWTHCRSFYDNFTGKIHEFFHTVKKKHCQYFVRCFAMLSYKPLWLRDPCRINLLWVPNRKTWVWRTSFESRIHLYRLQLSLMPVVAMTSVVGFISTHAINGYNNLDFWVWSLYMASCSQYNLML